MTSTQQDEITHEVPAPDWTWLRWGVIVFLLLVDIVINLGQNEAISLLVELMIRKPPM